jgi:hypothetical protein
MNSTSIGPDVSEDQKHDVEDRSDSEAEFEILVKKEEQAEQRSRALKKACDKKTEMMGRLTSRWKQYQKTIREQDPWRSNGSEKKAVYSQMDKKRQKMYGVSDTEKLAEEKQMHACEDNLNSSCIEDFSMEENDSKYDET